MVISSSNDSGFTLIEMMVAMVIITVGMLGLLATIDVSMQHTSQDQLRELAVSVGDEQMRNMQAVSFVSSAFTNTTTVSRMYRNGSVPYHVTRTSSTLGANSNELTILVEWKHRGVNQQHQVKTVKSQ